jgi:hypothetical protein
MYSVPSWITGSELLPSNGIFQPPETCGKAGAGCRHISDAATKPSSLAFMACSVTGEKGVDVSRRMIRASQAAFVWGSWCLRFAVWLAIKNAHGAKRSVNPTGAQRLALAQCMAAN